MKYTTIYFGYFNQIKKKILHDEDENFRRFICRSSSFDMLFGRATMQGPGTLDQSLWHTRSL